MYFKKLLAYQKSFDLAMSIFESSKSFPKEETYSLTDQISTEDYSKFSEEGKEIGKLINYMINNPEKFGVKVE